MHEGNAAYRDYERWKKWTSLFAFDADKAGYFAGEMQGIALRGAHILELGFGSGDFLAWAKSEGATVAGTEVNDVLLAAARDNGVETLPAAIATVAEQHSGRFDAVIAFDVFEHFDLDEIRSAMAACRKMLKPGGRLILRFPNAQSPFGLPPQNGDITHKSRLSLSTFEQILDHDAFAIDRYGPPFRFLGTGLRTMLTRRLRGAAQATISALLNAVYSQDIPWHPVVVLVLRRQASTDALPTPARGR